MPLYSYECQCGKMWEEIMGIEERNIAPNCPSCGRGGGKRLLSAPKPILFRKGFYRDASHEGVWAEKPQDLQDALNMNDGVSEYLENSAFKVRRDYDRGREHRAQSGVEVVQGREG